MKKQSNINETRQRILVAAQQEFLYKGYDATRLEDIVRDARVSKTAIYKIFGGKRELFIALNESMISNILVSISIIQDDTQQTLETLNTNLTNLGMNYLSNLLKEENRALFRLNVSIAHRFKLAATEFYVHGPAKVHTLLNNYFEKLNHSQLLNIPNTNIAAAEFMAAVRGNIHIEALLDVDYIPTQEEIAQNVNSAVNMFINGYKHQN